MGQGFVVNVLSLLSELFHNVIYLDCVPVQNGVRHKAKTAGLVHNFLIITSSELTLVGKKDPARQLVPVFSFIQLPLDGSTQFLIRQVAQNVFSLDDPS